ncbi:MAG TPA: SCO family protein, partial [Nocardioides sp.]|nr:SCO family protein [Nocardioides sp.]
MTRRRPPALVGAVLSLLLLAGCGSPAAPTAPHFAKAGDQLDLPLPAAVKRLRFTDSNGRTVRLSDFAGKTIVVGDMLTLCQEHCPIDTATLVLMAHEYAATAADPADTVFLSITVDPVRDTPAQLAAYRHQYVGSP